MKFKGSTTTSADNTARKKHSKIDNAGNSNVTAPLLGTSTIKRTSAAVPAKPPTVARALDR